MRGAIAAGHPLTAAAGARVLAAGGNAVDACVAAGFASWVAESPLTGAGGGGFMLIHRSRDRSTRVLDFFTAVPERPGAEMEAVDVDFSGGDHQVFQIGPASVAVPGTLAGLEEAHRRFGSLPWQELVAPAVDLARGGVELTRPQAYLHAILDLILRHTDEGRKIYGRADRLAAGDVLVQEDLAGSLELIARKGARALYGGELGRAAIAHLGRRLTRRDLESYRVIQRRPVRAPYAGHEFQSNPPPSSGGVLIGYGLRLLEQLPDGPPGSARAMASLAETMRAQAEIRGKGFVRALYRGGLSRRLEVARGTTHISVVDAWGNATAMTCSTGAGSGVIVPGTGIQLNNMLGEFDLARPAKPGARLSSMMSPSIVVGEEGPRLVVGSAGSLRLRGAVMQIVVNVVGHDLAVEEAIERPRVHWEDPVLHCEGGHDPAELDELEQLGWELVRWRRRNLYFGGAAAVETLPSGELRAAGDPRRGGAGVVVG
jgi:gamma-glutamyltranspeptidase/glutathione hydrolase